jgi:hypothetical protein
MPETCPSSAPVDSPYPERAPATPVWAAGLVTAVSLNVTAIWTDRRYLDMSLLKSKEVVVARRRDSSEELHASYVLCLDMDLT